MTPQWPGYFPRVGQPDATTWHYRGYLADTRRVWRAYYRHIFRHPLMSCIGSRQFYQCLVYRVFGVSTGDRLMLLTTTLTPMLTLAGPLLSLLAVSIAQFPGLKKRTPPLFQQFTLMGWSNYCCMLQLVFSWHGYHQYRAKVAPLQCLEQSSKQFWNDFFTDNLRDNARATRIVGRSINGMLSNRLPKRNILVKPEFGGAGYKLRSFKWDARRNVYLCDDAERAAFEPGVLTPHELETYITSQDNDFVIEELERVRDPLPTSTLRILTTHFGNEPALLSAAFLVAPDNSVSTAYFDIDGYLIDFANSQVGKPFKYGSTGACAGLPLPELHDVISTCLKLHSKLAGHLEISWDVMLTDDGPVFLEGNVFPPGCDYKLSIFKSDANLDFIQQSLTKGHLPAARQ